MSNAHEFYRRFRAREEAKKLQNEIELRSLEQEVLKAEAALEQATRDLISREIELLGSKEAAIRRLSRKAQNINW